ncbi:MAG: hypothetical protein ACI4MS_01615 [Candidatus Coproplasma sp.]
MTKTVFSQSNSPKLKKLYQRSEPSHGCRERSAKCRRRGQGKVRQKGGSWGERAFGGSLELFNWNSKLEVKRLDE